MRRVWAWTGMALAALCAGAASAETLPLPDRGGVPESKLYDYGVMGPPASAAVVARADAAVTTPMAPGPVTADWASIQANYREPAWFADAKFGIFIHWGVYSAAAHGNEWYEKHMYAGKDSAWHAQHFGPQDRVGYKDLIPQFTAANWSPDAWAELFKAAGARYVIPTAQHHDNFANWDSRLTPVNAVKMGPHRDLIGDLAAAVRRQGLKFGVSNHGMENFTFVNPDPALDARLKAEKADLYDPQWAGWYHVADRSPAAMQAFLTDWVERNLELIDKYHPDILWWDNGVNLRVLDPLKEHVAAYYYNRAREWRQPVSLSTKWIAMAPSNDDTRQIGSILDFEKVGVRSPPATRASQAWEVDDTIGSTWGYTNGMGVAPASVILPRLIDTVAKGGNYLLNISPTADGTIPQAQQDTLRGVGAWLKLNADAIYGTRPWTQSGEGDFRFTTRGAMLYAIALKWPEGGTATIAALAGKKVTRVELLGQSLAFNQDAAGLHIVLPARKPDEAAWSFAIMGGVQ